MTLVSLLFGHLPPRPTGWNAAWRSLGGGLVSLVSLVSRLLFWGLHARTHARARRGQRSDSRHSPVSPPRSAKSVTSTCIEASRRSAS